MTLSNAPEGPPLLRVTANSGGLVAWSPQLDSRSPSGTTGRLQHLVANSGMPAGSPSVQVPVSYAPLLLANRNDEFVHPVLLADGQEAEWSYRLRLADVYLELNEAHAGTTAYRNLRADLHQGGVLSAHLWQFLVSEDVSLATKDGVLGFMVEVEWVCAESDLPEDPPRAEVVPRMLARLPAIATAVPDAALAVNNGHQTYHGRPVLLGFLPWQQGPQVAALVEHLHNASY